MEGCLLNLDEELFAQFPAVSSAQLIETCSSSVLIFICVNPVNLRLNFFRKVSAGP